MANRGLDELGEDLTGFGRTELRTIRHNLTRPAELVDAYMRQGATGGGLYSRPLKLYLALNGAFLVLLLFVGSERQLTFMIPEPLLVQGLEASGKSRDAFLADAEGWMTFLSIPFGAAAYALAMAPLLRWWDPDDLGWRRAFRATFAFLNVWTVPLLPLMWLSFFPATEIIAGLGMFGLAIVAFIRAGKGRWWTSPAGAIGKGLAAAVALHLAAAVSLVPVTALVLLGATYGR